MTTRTRILLNGVEIREMAEGASFRLDGTDYPKNWFKRGGSLPGYTVENYEFVKPQPPAETEWTVWYSVILDRLSDVDANSLDNYVERLPAKEKVRIKEFGVDNDNQTFRDKVAQLGADPDVILAP